MPASRLNPLLRLFICLIGVVVIDFSVQKVIEVAIMTTATLRHLDSGQLQREFYQRDQILLILLFYPPTLLWLWTCRHLFDRRSFSSLGLRPPRSGPDFLYGLVAGGAAISFLFGLLYVTRNVVVLGFSVEAFSTPARSAAVLWFCFMAFIAVGFMEEVSFRGYVQHNLAARFSSTTAIVLQSIAFASIHAFNVLGPIREAKAAAQLHGMRELWNNDQVRGYILDYLRAAPNLALIAVFFTVCYLRTGSLWFPIGFHAAWNFFLGCIYSLPVSGLGMPQLLTVHAAHNALLTGGSFGAEGSVLLTPLIIAMIYLLLRYPRHPQANLDLQLLREPSTASGAADEQAARPQFKTRFGSGQGADPETMAMFKDFTPPAAENVSSFAPRVAPIHASFEGPFHREEHEQAQYQSIELPPGVPVISIATPTAPPKIPVEEPVAANAPESSATVETVAVLPALASEQANSEEKHGDEPPLAVSETTTPAPAPTAAPATSSPPKPKRPAAKW